MKRCKRCAAPLLEARKAGRPVEFCGASCRRIYQHWTDKATRFERFAENWRALDNTAAAERCSKVAATMRAKATTTTATKGTDTPCHDSK